MSGRLLTTAMRIAPRAPLGAMQSSTHPSKHGKREVVGYGWNGDSIYMDRVDYPMPAIRFREDTQEIKVKFKMKLFSIFFELKFLFTGTQRKGERRLEKIIK